MASRFDIFITSTPPGPTQLEGVEMVNTSYLLTTMVDFTSETCLVDVIIPTNDDGLSFRSEIDHGGQQM